MLGRTIVTGIFVASELLVNIAKAESPDTTADIRCFTAGIVSSTLTKDASAQHSLQMMALYFLGRLDGREIEVDLKKRFVEEAGKMTRQDVGSEDVRCGKFIQERGAFLNELGQDLMRQVK
jgi:hypothetical protein